MLTSLLKSIMATAGRGISTINKLEKFKQFQIKVLASPLLFMQIWSVPPILHHIIFNWLVTIGPILYFFAGIIFTIVAQIYTCIIILSVPHGKMLKGRRFFTTDEQIRRNMRSQTTDRSKLTLNKKNSKELLKSK